MYVCICNAITENHILAAVEEGATNVGDLASALGLGAGCGTCTELAENLLESYSSAPTASGGRSADHLGVHHYSL